jgi:hypothetical protein
MKKDNGGRSCSIFSFATSVYLAAIKMLSQNLQAVNNKKGTLRYTNVLGTTQLTTFSYFIFLNEGLPLQVCNMPSTVQLRENEAKSITFSGAVVMQPEQVDALSATVELINLNFDR